MEQLIVPNHIAIILDGNGRWAKERGMSRSYGHLQGFNNLKNLTKYIFKQDVKVLSLYCFSTENFKRDKKEVDYLMNLAMTRIKELKNLKDVKIVFSGIKESPLPEEVIKEMNEIENSNSDNYKYILNLCINYGGQSEIVDATKKICNEVLENNLNIEDINIEMFSKYLYQDLPPVDLMIRTSGEQRISNFLLWQLSYSEFYFADVNFPDFNEKEFDKAILEYNKRNRRFGNVK